MLEKQVLLGAPTNKSTKSTRAAASKYHVSFEPDMTEYIQYYITKTHLFATRLIDPALNNVIYFV